MRSLVWMALGAFAWAGCATDAWHSDSQAIDSDGWLAEDAVTFEWDVTDTLQSCDFFVDLRHNQDYPFSNLYLFLEFTFPNGKIGRDTLGCDLADERGQWYGSGFGNLVDHRIGFREKTAFPLTGTYSVTIQHAMRLDPLPGITDVGFRLEAAQP